MTTYAKNPPGNVAGLRSIGASPKAAAAGYGNVLALPTLPNVNYPDAAIFVVTNGVNGQTVYQNHGDIWIAVGAGANIAGSPATGLPAFVARVGRSTATASSNTATVTTTADVAAGNTITLHIGETSGGTITSVTGGSLTWRTQKANGGGTTPNSGVFSAYCSVLVPTGTTFTATLTFASTAKTIDAYSWSGLQDAAADTTSGATNVSSSTILTNSLTANQTDNSELIIATFAVNEAQTNGQWTLPGWTLLSTGSSAGTLTLLVAYQITTAGTYSGTGTLTGAAAYSSSCAVLKGVTVTGTIPVANLIGGATRTSLRTDINGVRFVKEPDMDILEYLATGSSIGTDDSALLASALAGVTSVGSFTGGRLRLPEGVFIQNKPLINALNLSITGAGSEATILKAGSTFPTATLNGSHTFPVATVTLSSMPTNAPTSGVIALPGLTVVYSGTSGSTLTGCTTRGSGTYAGGSVVGWPMWQLGTSTGAAGGAFHCRLESLTVNCNDIAGSMGVYSCRIQEKSGIWDVIINHFMSYGIKIEPASSGGIIAQNWGCRDLYFLASASAPVTVRPISLLGTSPTAVPARGFKGVTTDTVLGTSIAGWAVEAANIGGLAFEDFNIEHYTLGGFNLGGTLGDVTNLRITKVTADPSSMGGDLVKINTGSNGAIIVENMRKGSCTNAINDAQNSTTVTTAQVAAYHVGQAGTVQANY